MIIKLEFLILQIGKYHLQNTREYMVLLFSGFVSI